ncbi:DUF3618 domain-containing protein [Actinomycetospora chiangmaiensis]|uniref:DUF3618 domain-containing protein n=1 Tax=Actinomycetospora chiangmaiensis TaxID=402650 RepID=UPI00036E1D64|nr:DUF3618 domain-containing protein [Actinomycetospora chiangmaiensis]
MARDPDTIEREIEQAREALAGALDELSERANPQRLADQGKEIAAEKWADPKIKYAVIAAGTLIGLLVLRKLLK